MKAALLALCLTGCAGQAAYSVKPFYEPNLRRMVCCEAVALNSKDIAALSFDLTTSVDGVVTVHFNETGVGATAPTAAQGAVISNVATAVSNAAAAAIKITP
ncbi:hypothetical protein [Paraburkholderia fungorum]|uniref:hypothetical protein n=1 Tax=Paraburkholderia fungorum TaxID=134537 RepID=UPI0038781A6A